MTCTCSQASIHPSRSRPLPRVQTGEGGPGLLEMHGHVHICRNPGLHTVASNATLQIRASASASQGGGADSAPQSLPSCGGHV